MPPMPSEKVKTGMVGQYVMPETCYRGGLKPKEETVANLQWTVTGNWCIERNHGEVGQRACSASFKPRTRSTGASEEQRRSLHVCRSESGVPTQVWSAPWTSTKSRGSLFSLCVSGYRENLQTPHRNHYIAVPPSCCSHCKYFWSSCLSFE